ncbi:GTP pyrophosphokinase family protein [Rhodococcus sp. Q]|uniref:GTP pyrophosphokinase n=1 Tax=Rhodococcus sp. Q TaxID=2502252 RepID=UPI0010FA3FDB|nr:GTP pyrophosphokinase family protein [Rhodococcus sp. Q]
MSTHLTDGGIEPELVILGDLFRDLTGMDLEAPPEPPTLETLRELQQRLAGFRLNYKFAIDATLTKINILREEFEQSHDYSPIEHVNTRLKSMESLVTKAVRIGCPPDIESIREQIRDIAGIRVTCAFVSDAYWVAEMLTSQPDVTLVQVKDYIANPKPNGYQSLHLIVQVPVYLSDRTESTYVEIQIRTIAMDFWASLEHKIYYKFDRAVPPRLLDELKQAADAATELDRTMARLHDEVTALDKGAPIVD